MRNILDTTEIKSKGGGFETWTLFRYYKAIAALKIPSWNTIRKHSRERKTIESGSKTTTTKARTSRMASGGGGSAAQESKFLKMIGRERERKRE